MKEFGHEVDLTTVCDAITYGYTASATDEDTGVKFLRITDIVPDRINWETVPFCPINEKDVEKYQLNIGDIVVARTGATTGWNKTIKHLNHKAVYASFLIKYSVDRSIADPNYVGYNLQSSNWYDYVEAIAGGSAQPGANAKQLGSFKFLLPPLPEQKAIASVLSSLDDKIDLLHRQNKTLEAMAETLFRQWFIEEAKEDWEEVNLKELVSVIDNRGKTPPYVEEKTAHPIIEVNALTKTGRAIDYSVIRKYVTKDTFDTWFRQYLQPLDVVLSTVGSIGSFGMFFGGGGCVAQNIIGLRVRQKISNYFLYQWLVVNTNEIKELDIGSVQPSIKVPHLLSLSVKIPPLEKIESFDAQVKAIVDKIIENTSQIQTLENLRDTLLPKLMSGEVRVQYQTEEVA